MNDKVPVITLRLEPRQKGFRSLSPNVSQEPALKVTWRQVHAHATYPRRVDLGPLNIVRGLGSLGGEG